MLYVDVLLYSEVFFCDYPHSTCIACHSKTYNNDQDAVERKEKETEFQKQQDEEIALKEKLNNLNDKDYIEKIARDDYYLSNKGEVILDYLMIKILSVKDFKRKRQLE